MTREELVQMREYKVAQASTEYWNKNKDNDEVGIITAFEDGVTWADEHPINPWISVADRLPRKLRKKNYSKEVLCRTDGGTLLVSIYNHKKREWADGIYIKITHWMPIPQIEKGE